jgi:TonB family protein
MGAHVIRLVVAANALLAWLRPTMASAQAPGDDKAAEDPRPARSSDVVPPGLVHDPGVRYPARALAKRFYERVDVVLILEIDDAGKVSGARVDTSQAQEFTEAALDAVEHLRFEPARRGGTPVAARIRYRYSFEPPPPNLGGRVFDKHGVPIARALILVRDSSGAERTAVTAPDGSWTVAGVVRGPARVRVEALEHVRQETEVLLTPGDETRVHFRLEPRLSESVSTEEAPVEVTVRGERRDPIVSSYTRAEVRQIPGAFGDPFRAIETLPGVTPVASGLPFFYVRGAPPGNVGYFLDGVRVPYLYHVGAGPSVVHPAIVERVDLYPGAYPARFGRFAGGIVSAEATDPRPELHGEGNLRLFDVGGLAETGFADGRGTALLGGRYSYTAALLSLAAPELELAYHDYQARFSYDVTPSDRVSVFSFGSYDLLKENDVIIFGSEFYRADIRYDHRFERGNVLTALTLGYDRTSAALLVQDDTRHLADRLIAARTGITNSLSSDVLLRAGADLTVDNYRAEGARFVDPDSPETEQVERLFPPRTDLATGLWLDFVFDVTSGVQVTPGLRADLYRSGAATAFGVDPRLAARVEVTQIVRIISAVGLVHQPPSFIIPLPGMTPALGDGLQRSLQISEGAEVDLDEATTAGTTFFYNAFFAMTDAFGTAGDTADANLDLRSRGWSYGGELFLRRRLTKRLGGFVSYTLSRSVRTFAGEQFLSAFDRTHVANVAVSCDLGRGWRAGARVLYYSGTPVWQTDGGTIVAGTTNVERDPSFFRLDLRLEKRWALGSTAWISFVAEFMNATLNKETWPGGEEIGPIAIPSLGVEAGF